MKTLTKGSPIKVILLFAIPLFIGQLFQLFYGLVDTRIVGSILGEDALASVGATTTLSDMLLSLLNGLTAGFAIITATNFGAENLSGVRKAVGGTFFLGIILTLIISALSLLLLPFILSILQISDELIDQSRSYIRIILAGLIASVVYNACAATLRALGNSLTPLCFLAFSAVLNIVLDYCFIRFLSMGVAGAAAATVISQFTSAILCLIYIKRRYPQIIPERSEIIPDRMLCGRLLRTGLSMGFMTSLVNLGSVALQTCINTLGTDIIVAHTAARKITSIFLLPFSILGATLATYCGQNLGAQEYERLRQGIRQSLIFAYIWSGLMIAAAWIAAPVLIRLITGSDNAVVVSSASLYLRFDTAFYSVTAAIIILRNSMQGIGDNKTPIMSSLIELLGKLLIAWFLAPAIGYWGIIVAEPAVWCLMVIPLIINIRKNPMLKK